MVKTEERYQEFVKGSRRERPYKKKSEIYTSLTRSGLLLYIHFRIYVYICIYTNTHMNVRITFVYIVNSNMMCIRKKEIKHSKKRFTIFLRSICEND